MKNRTKICFRADGHARMGLGHVIRSLALADMLKEAFDCIFIIRNPLPDLKDRILSVCQDIIEIPETEEIEKEAHHLAETYLTGEEIVVLDGYHFRTAYQRIIRATGCPVVCIDDIHACHFLADVIINHAGGVIPADYSAEDYTKFRLGLKYALLRPPFREVARNRPDREQKEQGTFICLGGADPNNDTIKVLKKCASLNMAGPYYVVVGSAYQYRRELDALLQSTELEVQVLSNLNAEQMVHYMKKCGSAITSPSTVSYEYLSVGGELYLRIIADNQKDIHRYFLEEGLAFDFEAFGSISQEQRSILIQKQRDMLDGRQQKRFKQIFNVLSLDIRNATTDDCMLYFEWANDSLTRKQSYSSGAIPLQDHIRWFNKKLDAHESILYLVSLRGKPVGQIRFDLKGKETAIISYALDKAARGKGIGKALLEKGIDQVQKQYGALNIIGFVKFENVPSVKAFRSLGFREKVSEEYPNSYKYILE